MDIGEVKDTLTGFMANINFITGILDLKVEQRKIIYGALLNEYLLQYNTACARMAFGEQTEENTEEGT